MSYSVEIPLDAGFLRRECPHCEREFKWHHGPTDERPEDVEDPPVYFCPYCGDSAPPDHWWTKDQLDFAQRTVVGPAIREMADDLKKSFGNQRNSMIKFSVSHNEPEPPAALQEPEDMEIVEPPCHPWEPMKVIQEWSEPLHCLVCGETFGTA